MWRQRGACNQIAALLPRLVAVIACPAQPRSQRDHFTDCSARCLLPNRSLAIDHSLSADEPPSSPALRRVPITLFGRKQFSVHLTTPQYHTQSPRCFTSLFPFPANRRMSVYQFRGCYEFVCASAADCPEVSSLVSWCLTSLLSSNMAISETNGHSL